MPFDLSHHLTRLADDPTLLQRVWFDRGAGPVPDGATQTDFPRLVIVLDGEITDGSDPVLLAENEVLYLPAGHWNAPQWYQPATTLTIHFEKQYLHFSVQRWDGTALQTLSNAQVARRGPRIGSFLLQTLSELQMQPHEQRTARLTVMSLLSHCADLLGSQIQTASRSQALFEAIRHYIDENYAAPLTRESVAQAFYISPNYLSHLFANSGTTGFNAYLNHIRLEHARMLLKNYDLKINEVAHACGFVDSNYFCRLFRKTTERTPSEYRRQYHSQLSKAHL